MAADERKGDGIIVTDEMKNGIAYHGIWFEGRLRAQCPYNGGDRTETLQVALALAEAWGVRVEEWYGLKNPALAWQKGDGIETEEEVEHAC